MPERLRFNELKGTLAAGMEPVDSVISFEEPLEDLGGNVVQPFVDGEYIILRVGDELIALFDYDPVLMEGFAHRGDYNTTPGEHPAGTPVTNVLASDDIPESIGDLAPLADLSPYNYLVAYEPPEGHRRITHSGQGITSGSINFEVNNYNLPSESGAIRLEIDNGDVGIEAGKYSSAIGSPRASLIAKKTGKAGLEAYVSSNLSYLHADGSGGWETGSGSLLVGDGVTSIARVTQAQYDLLSPPDPNTLYLVVEE